MYEVLLSSRFFVKNDLKYRDNRTPCIPCRLLSGVGGDGEGAPDHVFLGKEGKDFEFEDLKAKVEFCETSATADKGDDLSGMDRVQEWIAAL